MKRTSRRLSSETKQKISTALRNKPKTERHRQALSIALKKYWQTIPYEESVMESENSTTLILKVTKLAKMQE